MAGEKDKDDTEAKVTERADGGVEVELAEASGGGAAETRRVVEPEEGIEQLRGRLAAESAARQDAETRARNAEARASHAGSQADTSNIMVVESGLSQIKQQQDILKGQYRDALVAQDYDKAADIQMDISANAAKQLQLEQGLQGLKNRPKETPRQEVQRRADPVEEFASQLTPLSAAWIRKNPTFVTDPNKMRKMIAAHNLAEANGIAGDTPEYFDFVEQTVGLKQERQEPQSGSEADAAEPLSEAAAPAKRRSAPPAAPVNRGGSNNPRTMTLSREEKEIAEATGQTYEEFARNKAALQREGKLGRAN